MKLALTFDSETGNVFPTFENTRVIKLYEVEDGEIIHSELVGTMAETAEDIISLILLLEADGVICGDISAKTREQLDDEGILYYSGFSGDADEAVHDFVEGYVILGPDD